MKLRQATARRLLPTLLTASALLAAAPTAFAHGTPQPRIVGGHVAADGLWPSIVALENVNIRAGRVHPDWDQQICGGTLIAPQVVLTAAHCVTDDDTGAVEPASQYQILYGTHSLSSNTGTRVQVTEVDRNPAYVSSTTTNDVALLKLATPVPNATVLPLPSPAVSGLWAAGKLASVAGWGDVNQHNADPSQDNVRPSYPFDLMELTTLPLVSDADCGDVYDGFAPAVMLCGGDLANGGLDTCQGDSGGPLVVSDAAGHPVLAGDTSFGNGCAWKGNPGVYGEIAGMRAFIDSVMGWSTAASTAPAGGLTYGSAGTTQTATLTSTGTAPLSIASAALSGAGAGSFSIVRDGCSQVVLLPGQTCSVDVSAAAPSDATLSLVGDGAAGTQAVALHLAAPAPVVTTPPASTTQAPATTATTTTPSPSGTAPVGSAGTRVATVTLTALSGHRVRLKASGAGTARLTITRTVRHGRKKVTKTLATGTVTFTAAGTKTITLVLTRAGRAALKHGRHVTASATVAFAGTRRAVALTLR